MLRFKSRLIAVLTVIAMVALLVPAMPASAVLTDTGASGVPGKVATADANAIHDGVRVSVRDMPKDVTAIDVYRSTAAGVEGTKLNSEPVKDSSYIDTDVDAGTTYFYTIKVAARAAGVDSGRFQMLDVLPQISVTTEEADVRTVEAKSASSESPAERKPLSASSAALRASSATPERVAAMAKTVGITGKTTTLTANTTWTTAMSPIFVRGDIVVPAGKTLTIQPGVKVYFDTIEDYSSPYETKDNATIDVDLIVHGKLVAVGTASSRVLFTSILSLPTSATASGLPSSADWGCVYVDGTAPSVMSYCQVEYGSGCWSVNSARPYYTNNIFQQTGVDGDGAYRGAITFTNPKTDLVTPRVIVKSNRIATDDTYGILIDSEANRPVEYTWGLGVSKIDTSTAASNLVADAYIAGNTVKSNDACVAIWAWDYKDSDPASYGFTGNASAKGTVTGNRLWSSDNEAVYLYVNTGATDKIAKISTAMSGNMMTTTDDYGVYAWATAWEYGKAYVVPTLSGDNIYSYSQTFYGEAYSQKSSGAADTSSNALGAANVSPRFTNCALKAAEDDGVYCYAYSYDAGAAVANPVFVGGSLETASCEGVDAYAESHYGDASACPSFANVVAKGHNACEVVYANAYSYDDGFAKASPRWTGGSAVNLYDDFMYAYARSSAGSAEAKPYVANTNLYLYGAVIEADADASFDNIGNGRADVSCTLINVTADISNDYDAVDVEASAAGELGDAVASPYLSNVRVTGYVDDGVYAVANSHTGNAIASPVITNGTSLDAYYYGVYADANRSSHSSTTTAHAVASPSVSHSTVMGQNYEALSAESENDGVGNAVTAPKVHASRLENGHDDGSLYLYANKSSGHAGVANIAPLVDTSVIHGENDYAIEAEANGPGFIDGGTSGSIIGGTFKSCTITSPYYAGFYEQAHNLGGATEITTRIENCAVRTPDDYAGEFYVHGWGRGDQKVRNAPQIIGGSANVTGDGYYFDTRNEDLYWNGFATVPTPGSNSATSPVVCAPVLMNTSVYATWDYPIETETRTFGTASAVDNSYVYNTSLKGYYSVRFYTWGESYSTGDVENNAQVIGVSSAKRAPIEAFDDDGIYVRAYSAYGDAKTNNVFRYLTIDPQYDGVYSRANADNGTSTVLSKISGNVVGTKWNGDEEGLDVRAYGGDTVFSPSLIGNVVGPVTGYGIHLYNEGDSSKFNPVVSGNTVGNPMLGVDDDAIYFYNSVSTELPGSQAVIAKNIINHPYGNGIYLSDVDNALVQGNKITFPGFGNSSTNLSDISGIYWYGASGESSPSPSVVRGNLITNARTGISYQAGWATTRYNVFGAAGTTAANRPWNLYTDESGLPTTKLDATSNWWGTSNATAIRDSIYAPNAVTATDVVDYAKPLAGVTPQIKSIAKSKSGSTYTFKVTFDRSMDTGVKQLTFGKVSPFKTYKTKVGTWNTDGTVLTVKFTGTIASGKYYFAGARDWLGTAVNAKSKSISLP